MAEAETTDELATYTLFNVTFATKNITLKMPTVMTSTVYKCIQAGVFIKILTWLLEVWKIRKP